MKADHASSLFIDRPKSNSSICNQGVHMNQSLVEGKWKEFKGEFQKTWGKVTNDEMEKAKGDIKSLSGIIQQKYGIMKEDASDKFSSFLNKFEEGFKDTKGEASKTISKAANSAKKSLKH
jgi:uncharacterized protein YjbJ (UPF0337 family)